MKRFYDKQDGFGYIKVVGSESELEVLAFDLIRLTPCDDPKHAWVKAVEQMV